MDVLFSSSLSQLQQTPKDVEKKNPLASCGKLRLSKILLTVASLLQR
jgi:hypothetical protein